MVLANTILIVIEQMKVVNDFAQHDSFICFQIQMPVLPNTLAPGYQTNNYKD